MTDKRNTMHRIRGDRNGKFQCTVCGQIVEISQPPHGERMLRGYRHCPNGCIKDAGTEPAPADSPRVKFEVVVHDLGTLKIKHEGE
jgi:hypothetical protein